jgi:hypothetical protein
MKAASNSETSMNLYQTALRRRPDDSRLLTANISLNSVNRLIFVTVKFGVFFAVRTGFLYNI